MKRKVILLAFIAALVLGIVGGGVAYAVDGVVHQPFYGDKLVGTITTGESVETFGTLQFGGHATITNPDCVNAIEITRLSLLDMAGNVIMEGPPADFTDFPETLGPHQSLLLPIAPDVGAELQVATLEIAWEARRGTCPLTGTVFQGVFLLTDETLDQFTVAATEMVNLSQRR